MSKLISSVTLLVLVVWAPLRSFAEGTTNIPASLVDRVADLEAHVTNGARQTKAPTALTEVAGPGHNAWQTVPAALVLFMTLPGLALFYGGLVRRKNVPCVLAQCHGIAGLVTILWWLCAYSNAFHSGKPFDSSLDWAMLRGVDSKPNADYGASVSWFNPSPAS